MNIFDQIAPAPSEIVLASVPWTLTSIPLMAVAALKSVAINQGKSCTALDLNANVLNWSQTYQHKDKLLDFFHNETYHAEIQEDIFNLYLKFAETLLAHQPKIIGLSLFSYVCQVSAKYITYFIRKLDPTVTIIIGGTGCFSQLLGDDYYPESLLKSGLIDYYVRGDAEQSFSEFLKGHQSGPGINSSSWIQMTNDELQTLPYPDYSDYDFNLYSMPAIPLIGSRGCVRQCTFCDYIEHWKKFNWRNGQNIFDEMLLQNKKYGIRYFKFQDSLINGNLKEYKKLVQLLATHNQQHPNNSFFWSSFFILRGQGQFNEELWRLTALSGATWLNVGVESVVEHIRYHMGKKFSNDDVEFGLRMDKKYNLKFTWLMIVGYVTETQEDIDYTKQWFKDHVTYKDTIKIQLGGTLGIFPNTWLDRNKEKLNVVTFGMPYQKWNNTVTGSSPSIRAQWQKELFNLCVELGYDMYDDIDNHYVLELMMRENYEQSKSE